MEVVQCREAFQKVNGKLKFYYTKGIIRWEGLLYSAKWESRQNPFEFLQLYETIQFTTIS
jgi:hypothetical protein